MNRRCLIGCCVTVRTYYRDGSMQDYRWGGVPAVGLVDRVDPAHPVAHELPGGVVAFVEPDNSGNACPYTLSRAREDALMGRLWV